MEWQQLQDLAANGSGSLPDIPTIHLTFHEEEQAAIASVDPYVVWRRAVDVAFADYASIRVFPQPPMHLCNKEDCPSRHAKARALNVCDCAVREAFKGMSRSALGMERVRWHPDKFARVSIELRDEFQKMAGEIFVVVNDMYHRAPRLHTARFEG